MSQANPRVFVTQENSQLNYGHAEEFGQLVFLTRDEVSPVPGSLVNGDIVEELTRKLADFDPEYDFLAPSGSPVVCGLAFYILASHIGDSAPNTIRVLRWSNRDRVYQPIHITI